MSSRAHLQRLHGEMGGTEDVVDLLRILGAVVVKVFGRFLVVLEIHLRRPAQFLGDLAWKYTKE